MKIKLPKNSSSYRGFTLVELLVVIAIISVLAIMGFAAFRGFTGKGNDDRRYADLKAIANALEANKTTVGYQVLADSQFASGSIPDDPSSSKNYCVSYATTANPTIGNKPGAFAATCPIATAGVGVNGSAFSVISTTAPIANTTGWMICATLEDAATVYCRVNSQ